MKNRRIWVGGAIAAGLTAWAMFAQNAQVEDPDALPAAIKVNVQNILVPVTVTAPDGTTMNNLQPNQFHLYDNGKDQEIHVEMEAQPISLVVAIESSRRDDAVLKQIHKIGSLIEPLVIGENGEAAVVAFDGRLRTLQDFTNDSTKLKDAIAKITSGSSSSRMIDAVDYSMKMLRHRPANRRKVILLVSETRDNGSVARGRQTLIDLQFQNITLYAADITQIARRFTEQAEPPRPSAIDPAARPMSMGQPSTPTTVAHDTGVGSSIEFVPALKEIYTNAKAIFIRNPIQVFTKGTGGAQFSFLKERGLEDAISKIGSDIHSQYLITYKPNNLLEGGFHEISVAVDYPNAKVRTRPGYWLAAIN